LACRRVLDTIKRSNYLIYIHITGDRKVLNFPNFPKNRGSYTLSSGEKALFATSIGDGTETQNSLVAARRESLPGQQSKIAILSAVFRRGRPGQMEPLKRVPMRLFKNKHRFALASAPKHVCRRGSKQDHFRDQHPPEARDELLESPLIRCGSDCGRCDLDSPAAAALEQKGLATCQLIEFPGKRRPTLTI
jgi:hypothetical protein